VTNQDRIALSICVPRVPLCNDRFNLGFGNPSFPHAPPSVWIVDRSLHHDKLQPPFETCLVGLDIGGFYLPPLVLLGSNHRE